MKRIFALLAIAALVTGCSGLNINNDTAILTAIELAGYNAGYYVGSKKPELDAQISIAYDLARKGTLTPAQMAEAFSALKISDPQLAGSLMIVLTNMGATVDAGGGILSLSAIPAAYWDRAAQGYTMGFEMGKANTKSVAPSAVKALLPAK